MLPGRLFFKGHEIPPSWVVRSKSFLEIWGSTGDPKKNKICWFSKNKALIHRLNWEKLTKEQRLMVSSGGALPAIRSRHAQAKFLHRKGGRILSTRIKQHRRLSIMFLIKNVFMVVFHKRKAWSGTFMIYNAVIFGGILITPLEGFFLSPHSGLSLTYNIKWSSKKIIWLHFL